MEVNTGTARETPSTKGSEGSACLGPHAHIEALRDTLQMEWLQFRYSLDLVAMQQLKRQEELIARCLENMPREPANACDLKAGDCESEPQSPKTTGSRTSENGSGDVQRGTSWMEMARQCSPQKFQDMVQSKEQWCSERSLYKRSSLRTRFSWLRNPCAGLEEPPRTGPLARLIGSKPFETLCIIVIVSNSALSAVALNHEITEVSTEPTPFIKWAEYFFVTFYTVELALKLAVHRLYYFCNSDMSWNIFDALLVTFSLFDQMLTIIMTSSGGGADFGFMRTLRILKMARVLRGLRVMRFFSVLRLMLNSLIGSVSSLMWSILMLALIFYIFGLIFVQGAANYLIDAEARPDTVLELHWRLVTEFGSVQQAVLSLFKACTGGDDWKYFLWAIEPAGTPYAFLFLFFIAFSQIALLNILTAIFVQRAMKLAQPDRETQALIERGQEIEDIEELRRVLHEADQDGDGRISAAEFCVEVKRGKLGAQMTALGLNVKNAALFFGLVAAQDDVDSLDVDDFVERCMQMRGAASCIEMHIMNTRLQSIQQALLEAQDNHAKAFVLMAAAVMKDRETSASLQL